MSAAAAPASPGIPAERTVFREALPYGVGTLIVGGVSLAVALTTSSQALMVAGFAGALFGAWGCIGVISAARSSDSAQHFHEIVHEHVTTAVGAGAASALDFAVKSAIDYAIQRAMDAAWNRIFGSSK